jgi:asparagine synthase (glutamine-hydrolysing)
MCGISGIITGRQCFENRVEDLERMTDRLSHRGPDGRGVHWEHTSEHSIGLGHRRLSIIDLATGGQPLCNENSDVWITFNGEIYNYVELRVNLEASGHRFRTNTDTETIVHLYEEFGHDCVSKLRGMFAFAIWDNRKRELFFARDRLGEKPFVYSFVEGDFCFASELKALKTVRGFSRQIDQEGLFLYLTYGFVPHPYTIFQNARKLPPAHYGVWKDGRLEIRRYWEIDATPDHRLSSKRISERVNELVHDAVRVQLRSDVPLGAFLSGGMDSNVIVSTAQDLLKDPLRTFTIGFSDASYDESEIASDSAKHYGTNHIGLRVLDGDDDSLDRVFGVLDEPFADTSCLSTYQVVKLASERIKVVLTGDGGDELFAGYDRYHTVDRLQSLERIPIGLKAIAGLSVWDRFKSREPDFFSRLAYRFQTIRHDFSDSYARWFWQFSPEEIHSLFGRKIPETLNGPHRNWFKERMQACSSASYATQAMYADMSSYLPDDLLYKVDMMSMSQGLECRSPFLDHHLIEFLAKVDFVHHRRKSNQVKPVLANAFVGSIPNRVVKQPKRGFGIPLESWLTGYLGESIESLFSKSTHIVDVIGMDPEALSEFWEAYKKNRAWYANRVWILYSLEKWLSTEFIDGK